MLELRQLRYFQAVADELHFGHAAQKLNIVQPALSMQIKALEDELGTPLFIRDHHKVQMSAAGLLFHREVSDILNRLSHAVLMVDRAARGEVGQLRIGASVGALTNDYLPNIIKVFRKTAPDVEISLQEIHPAGQASALAEGVVDLVFGPSEAFKTAGNAVTGHFLAHFALKLACSIEHPLAHSRRVHFDALRKETFVGLSSEEDHLGMQITRYALPYIPKHTLQVRSPVALFSVVEANLAVSVISESLERNAPPNIVFLDLDGVNSNMDLYLYHKSETRDLIVGNFLQAARSYPDYQGS